jgi:hypothetical protein
MKPTNFSALDRRGSEEARFAHAEVARGHGQIPHRPFSAERTGGLFNVTADPLTIRRDLCQPARRPDAL